MPESLLSYPMILSDRMPRYSAAQSVVARFFMPRQENIVRHLCTVWYRKVLAQSRQDAQHVGGLTQLIYPVLECLSRQTVMGLLYDFVVC